MTNQQAAGAPSEGLVVLHLFAKATAELAQDRVLAGLKAANDNGIATVTVSILGHKADLAIMALTEHPWKLRDLQSQLSAAGLEILHSYLSITELSEYAQGLPEEAKNARLYPNLDLVGKPAWCFYPMSKRREWQQNWYTTSFDERKEMMYEHGSSGRKFAGRLVQLITASTGIDDFEWGVTLFAERIDLLKEVVYTMRYDQASAIYADFGPFYTGMVATPEQVLSSISHY